MSIRGFIGAITLGGLMGLAALAGGVMIQTTAAGAPIAQTAQATATPAPGTPNQGLPGDHGPGFRGHGMKGFEGPGFGGFFGGRGFDHGFGPKGGAYTSEGASRVISATGSLITLVKGDLAYANGKMDTATVQDWLNKADGLLKAAQTAANNSQFGQARETAEAAKGLAMTADLLMQQALGADKLPSYNQRPFPGKGRMGAPPNTTTVTQTRASRELANLYNQIVATDALLKASSKAGDASAYLTAAKNYYKTAYTAYQAAKYDDAHKAATVSQSLLRVVDDLLRAATAPNNADTPVQVPAPNF
jgi:hypothetical protein